MIERSRCVPKSLVIPKDRIVEMPKPLDETLGHEMERKQCIARVMTRVLKYLTSEFTARQFEWLLPVVFSQSTDPLWPDQNASIEKRLEVEIYGKTVRPTASMIVHKMVACSVAYPRLFALSPNIRVENRERAKTGVHAYEFTQLDFEVRDARSEDIRDLVQEIICSMLESLKREMSDDLLCLRAGRGLTVPAGAFKVYDRNELKKRYGERWEQELKFKSETPFWVVNIPREFYDFEDFEAGFWDNYDLFLPGFGEVLSGARREFEYDKIVKKMNQDGVRKESYRVLLKLAREGRLRPSAGAGIGVERLVSWIVEAKHVGEVQPFPRVPGTVFEL